MYNAELKIKFIRSYTRSINHAANCEALFNATEPYEQKWNADVCTKSAEELKPMMNKLSGLRERSKYQRLNIIKAYVRWCLENNIDGACDGALSIEQLGLDKIKTMMVSGPTHLQVCLDLICDKESETTIDCIYRCYYWLAFGGVKEEDILNIKCSDVDLTNMIVKYGDKDVPIYREAIQAFRIASTSMTFNYKHPLYKSVISRDRVAGEELIRGIRSAVSLSAMRTELSRRNKKHIEMGTTDKQLSYNRVWMSGLFYRMYERERAGIPVDFSGVVAESMEGKTYKLESCRNTISSLRRKFEKSYLVDYERWKEAYRI